MVRPTNPDRAICFQDWLARLYPELVKLEVVLDAFGFIPFAFVDRHAAASVAGEAVVGKVVWRVCKYHVESGWGDERE